MRFIVALWRFAIAGFCFVGTYEAWSKPQFWVYFTFQTGFVLGIVMLWSGAATLLKGIQPPAWLKGCLTVYAIVTALVAFFLTPPDDPAYVPQVIGIMTNTMLHKIAPIMAVIDFVLFDPHRRFRWHYMFSWLAYFPAYLDSWTGPCGDLAGVRTGGRRQSVSVRLHQPRRTRLARVRH